MAKKAKKTSKKKASVKKTSQKKTAKKSVKKTTIKKTAAKKKTTKKSVKKKVTAKRKVAKKTAIKKKKAPKRKKSSLTKQEIAFFRELLLQKSREIMGDVNSIENDALKKSRLDAAGDLSSMPIHMADMGTDNFEQEFALGLMDSERKLLAEIHQALVRINEGVYGICVGTNKSISKARLKANPWAKYCIEYATMVEKGLVIEGEMIYDEKDDDEEISIIGIDEQDDNEESNYDLLDYENMDSDEDEDY